MRKQIDFTHIFESSFNSFTHLLALKRAGCLFEGLETFLFAASVFGYGFRSFADGVFGQLSGQKQTNSGLDFP